MALGVMETLLQTYTASIASLGAIGSVMLIQLIIADATGIFRKHVPGTKITDDHNDLLFRVSRTVTNTNESIAIFVCVLLFCAFSGASPEFTAYAAWSYVSFRVAYATFYYLNLQTLRSISFGFSALALLALLLVGIFT